MSNTNGRINTIQLLRAVAVMLVVYCHVLDGSWINSFQKHFFYLENFGAVGVDIFFVISGFIITVISSVYAKEKEGFYFFIRRIVRVVPLYWLCSFIIVVLDYLKTNRLHSPYSILKTILFIPFPADKTSFIAPIIFQGWTLSFELIFYVIISIAIAVTNKKYLLVTAMFFLFFIALDFLTGYQNVYLNFLGNGIVLEFLLGVIIGIIFLSGFFISKNMANIIFITGIGCLLASIFTGFGNISEAWFVLNGTLSLPRALVWGLPAALLVGGLVMKEKAGPVNIHVFWITIGNASYSIYLTHTFFLRSLYLRFRAWHINKYIHDDILIIITMAIVIALGWLFYKLVEVPLLRMLGGFVNRKMSRRLTVKMPQQI